MTRLPPRSPLFPSTPLFLSILAFAIANLALTQAFSQGPAQPPMISVSGSAEVKVAPDEIYLKVGVETRHDNLEDAKKQNEDRKSTRLNSSHGYISYAVFCLK